MLLFLIGLLIVLLIIGMPIGFVLIFIGSVGIFITSGFDSLQGILEATAFRTVNNFTYSSIPLFILMAHFIAKSKIADDLFNTILKWVGHRPGGTGIATITGTAGFGALTGTSIAAVAVMSKIAVPKMVESNYSKSLSTGLVASLTGPLACLIPPSIPLIVYGIQTENSIGHLLIAGVIPGLLLAFLACVFVIAVGIKRNSRTEKFPWKERFIALRTVWSALLLILIIVGVIYLGIATPTEAAAFGAFGALFIGVVMKRLNFKDVKDSAIITVKQSSMLFLILIGAQLLTYYVTITRISTEILNWITASSLSALGVLILVIIMYLVLGMFLDVIGSMLLTLPVVYPLIEGLGYDPIWFGVLLVLILEIGMVTPPMGINLYLTSQYSGIPVHTVLKGSIPFIIILLVTVSILVAFPQIALFLPALM